MSLLTKLILLHCHWLCTCIALWILRSSVCFLCKCFFTERCAVAENSETGWCLCCWYGRVS